MFNVFSRRPTGVSPMAKIQHLTLHLDVEEQFISVNTHFSINTKCHCFVLRLNTDSAVKSRQNDGCDEEEMASTFDMQDKIYEKQIRVYQREK